MKDAENLRSCLRERFADVGFQINENKSKIVYIDAFERRNVDLSFTFLGYDFKVRTLKDWRIHRSTTDSLETLAGRYNAILRAGTVITGST